jgi:hypothetical protein
MTKVSIVSVPIKDGKTAYYAVAGNKHTFGNTAGEALDALTTQLTEEKSSTLVIVQYHQPDHYFDEKQQQQLATLMTKWRGARDQGQSLTENEQDDLENLIEAELLASANRTRAILDDLQS